MQNRLRMSKLYACTEYSSHTIVFTAVYTIGAKKRENFRVNPAVAFGIWIALVFAYAALPAAVVGISRLNDSGEDERA